MNIAVVDDVKRERDCLCDILRDYAAAAGVVLELRCFSRAEELLADYRPLMYTVIFMDIFMDGMSGVDAAEQIRISDSDTLLIFFTTSDEYMSRAFMIHAFDYIRKPFDAERIFRVMDDILKRRTAEVKRFAFSSDRRDYLIPYAEIVAVRTSDHYLEITTADGMTYRTRMTFAAAAAQLSEDRRFLPILRGVLVNMDYIRSFGGGACHLEGDIHLPINVRNSRKIEQMWRNYVFAKIRNEAMERGIRK